MTGPGWRVGRAGAVVVVVVLECRYEAGFDRFGEVGSFGQPANDDAFYVIFVDTRRAAGGGR